MNMKRIVIKKAQKRQEQREKKIRQLEDENAILRGFVALLIKDYMKMPVCSANFLQQTTESSLVPDLIKEKHWGVL